MLSRITMGIGDQRGSLGRQGLQFGFNPLPPQAVPIGRAAYGTLQQQLLVLNLALQVFDGLATYVGIHVGIPEANPILRASLEFWGIAQSLLLFKFFACGALLLVYNVSASLAAGRQLATIGLAAVAGIYSVASLMGWLAALTWWLVAGL